jgi:hypothetical protein
MNMVLRLQFKAINQRRPSLTRSHRFGNGEFTKFLEEEFFSREETRVYGVLLASIPVCPHGVQVKTLRPLNLIIKMQSPCTTTILNSK